MLKFNILKSRLFLFFLLVPFFIPAYLYSIIPGLNIFIKLYRLFALIIIVLLYIKYVKKLSNILVAIVFMQFFIIISSYIHNQDYSGAIYLSTQIIFFVLITIIYLKADIQLLIQCILIIFLVNLSLNAVSIYIYYPNGIYLSATGSIQYFLGLDNTMIDYIYPMFPLIMIYTYNKKIDTLCILLLLISGYLVFKLWVGVLVIDYIISFIFYIMLFRNHIAIKIFSTVKFKTMFLIIMGINLLLVVMQNISVFNFIIVDFLGKSSDMSGRFFVYSFFLDIFANNLIIGFGRPYSQQFFVAHAHNYLLEIGVEGGIFALGLIIFIVLIVGYRVDKSKNMLIKAIMKFSIILFFILTIVSSGRGTVLFYSILTMAYYLDNINFKVRKES